MSLEREIKLAVPATFELPDLGSVGGLRATPLPPRRLRTIYVDTDDLRLARWGCGLRFRDGEGWTLKLPAPSEGDALVRSEHRFDGSARRVADGALDLVRAYVRREVLRPVVRLRTLRRGFEILDGGEGARIGELVDDEVSVLDGGRVLARFREIEIEVAEGVPISAVSELVAALRAAGAVAGDGRPKLVRALGARAQAPPEVVVEEPGQDATVAGLVRAGIAEAVLRLIRHDPGVRLGVDIEDVHQARVATRRLRSLLRTFADVLEQDRTAALRTELAWLGGELGAVRDLDVQTERLRGRAREIPASDRPVVDRLIARRAERRGAARERLLAAMRSPRYLDLLEALVGWSAVPPVRSAVAEQPARDVLRPTMERSWSRLRSAMAQAGDGATDEQLHAVRIRAKRARYAAEALAPVFGPRARSFARAAARLQDVLGEHQDAVVAQAWLRSELGGGVRRAFVLGELAMLEAQAASTARATVPEAWRSLARKRNRFWRGP